MSAEAQAAAVGHGDPTQPTSATPVGVPARLDSLTGLRFLAALGVLVHHVTGNYAAIPAIDPVSSFGATGVTFFFILSGFVLTWSWTERERVASFYWRRFARIWPLHALLLAAAVVAQVALGRVTWTGSALSVPLLQAWVPDSTIFYAGNPPAWSLSCELFFYALFPLAMPLLARLPTRHIRAGAVVLLVGMSGASAAAGASLPPELAEYVVYISPPYRLTQFLLGVLLAVALQRGAAPRVSTGTTVLGVVACPVLLFHVAPRLSGPAQSWLEHLSAAFVPLIFGLLILAVAARDVEGRPSLLRLRPLVRLGQWSFALYLVHLLLVQAARVALGEQAPSNGNLLDLVALCVLAVAVSGLLFHFFERPVERWLRASGPHRASGARTTAGQRR